MANSARVVLLLGMREHVTLQVGYVYKFLPAIVDKASIVCFLPPCFGVDHFERFIVFLIQLSSHLRSRSIRILHDEVLDRWQYSRRILLDLVWLVPFVLLVPWIYLGVEVALLIL